MEYSQNNDLVIETVSVSEVREKDNTEEYKKGVVYTALSFLLWGIFPIYWKALVPVNPLAIMFYRMIMAFVFVMIIILVKYDIREAFAKLKNRIFVLRFAAAGFTISINWGIYIWMVSNKMVVQSSLGYFINPLVSCLFGAVIFRERITIYKGAAFALSGAGVMYSIIVAGEAPVFGLILAVSFAIYSAVKKDLHVNPVFSLMFETMFMLPVVVPWLIYLEAHGIGASGTAEPYQWIMLILCGVVTAIPLILYGAGANRLPLMTLGMIQYLSPTLQLIMGVFLFHETFTSATAITFLFIWAGVAVFSLGSWKEVVSERDGNTISEA